MRPLLLFSLFATLCLSAGSLSAEPLSVSVGKRSTWINLETGDQSVRGRSVRKVEIDTALLREKCDRAVEHFEGYVRLRHEARGTDWTVRVECMQRVTPQVAAETPPTNEEESRSLMLEARAEAEAENS